MEVGKLFSGKLNLDDVSEAMPDGDYSYLINGVIGTSFDGKRGSVENMVGASSVTAYGSGFRCIGGCREVATNKHFLFLCDTVGTNHQIVEVKQESNGSTSTRVLYSGSTLGFNINNKIQATCVNKYIYFTDNSQPIRCAKVWETGETTELSNLMRRGGIYAPTFVKSTDSSVALNLIGDKYFQFAYQYVYQNNEISVLSPYSTLCPANLSTQNFNKVAVSIPVSETIPDSVKTIKFAVRIGNNTAFQYIGSIDKVNGSFPSTSIDFYNSVYGGVVEVDYEINEYSVPITAKSVEFIKNRLWIGNLVEGYDIPLLPSMQVAVSSLETQNVGDPIYQYNTTFNYVKKYTYKVIDNGNGTETWYIDGSFGSLVENQFDKVYQGTNQANNKSISGKRISASPILVNGILAYEITNSNYSLNGDIPFGSAYGSLVPVGSQTTFTQPLSGIGTRTYYSYRIGDPFTDTLRTFVQAGDFTAFSGQKTFTNNSAYRVGLVYKDSDGRSSGVVLANSEIRTSSTVYSNRITAEWTLPVDPVINSVNVIPSWAKSYHIVLSKNLTKSFFFEARSARINYYKDSTLSTTYAVDNTGIKIDITPVLNGGLAYSFENGDRVVIYKPDGTNTYNLPIKEFTSGNIVISNTNIGTLSGQTIIIEVYRPQVSTDDVLYYEIGQGYAINDPGTSTRSFSTTTGSITGDTYNFLRDTYFYNGTTYVVSGGQTLFKQMSLDIKSAIWNTDGGKIYVVSDKNQIIRPYTFRHSGTFIDGTEVNGLSEFYSADEANVPYENGEIMKLKSANRTASEGTVLLAICRERVASIYVGESRLNINSETNFLVTGSQVIGEVNTLQGWYGTNHPSSVFDDGKNVYWFSQTRRSFVRYSQNGIFPISDFKVGDFFNDLSEKDKTTDSTFVCGGYFPFYDIIMVTVNHSLSYNLTPGAENSLEKTISYSDANQAWVSFHSIIPDYYFDIADKMFTIQGGTLYRHDNNVAFGSYAGQKHFTRIKFPVNNNPLVPKVWKTVTMYGSPKFYGWPGTGYQELSTSNDTSLSLKLTNQEGSAFSQMTTVLMSEMKVYESVIYAPIGFDENSPGGFTNGEDMLSTTLNVEMKFKSDDFRYLTLVNVGFIPSMGHTL